MFAEALSRRAFLRRTAGASVALLSTGASARGRLAMGGRLAFHLPWPLGAMDPHRIDDGTAAILGDALFDTLYACDEAGKVAASLAEAEPEAVGPRLRVTLREGLRTGKGVPLDARDALFSLSRARSNGARAYFADLPMAKRDGPHSLLFDTPDAARLVRFLATPLSAIVPRSFSPESPDGTGPFRADRDGDALVLRRNGSAARGPAFLDEIVIRPAKDLGDSLRAFEGGTDDLGWLGSGLHEPRPGARAFDAGSVGWAVLRTGHDAREWDAPGVAQTLADGIPSSHLRYLGMGSGWPADTVRRWGGPPCEILVRDDAPWLIELARAVAANLGETSHDVTVRPTSPAEYSARRTSRAYAMAIDVVRSLAPDSVGALVSLSTADDPVRAMDVVRYPPRFGDVPVRTLTRTMRIGVLGEVRVQGGRSPDVTIVTLPVAGIDFGASTRARRGP